MWRENSATQPMLTISTVGTEPRRKHDCCRSGNTQQQSWQAGRRVDSVGKFNVEPASSPATRAGACPSPEPSPLWVEASLRDHPGRLEEWTTAVKAARLELSDEQLRRLAAFVPLESFLKYSSFEAVSAQSGVDVDDVEYLWEKTIQMRGGAPPRASACRASRRPIVHVETRCEGTTQHGHRCKRVATKGTLCWQHGTCLLLVVFAG